MTRLTVASLRRTLTPGTKLRIVNHVRPGANRLTSVHPKTNTVDLVTWATTKDGKDVDSHLSWPKAADLRADEHHANRIHIDKDGEPFLTIDVITDDDAPADWPATSGPLPPNLYVCIEREHGPRLTVGPYPTEEAAGQALENASLIDGLCEEDCLDAYTGDVEPGDERVTIDPKNYDHTADPAILLACEDCREVAFSVARHDAARSGWIGHRDELNDEVDGLITSGEQRCDEH